MIYYYSDPHFHDERVMRLCSRPFKNVEEQDKELVKRWNSKVNDEDTVYLLGDLSSDDFDGIIDLLKSLNGHKHLIIGNHDLSRLEEFKASGVFETIENVQFIKDKERDVILSHYPLMNWTSIIRNSYLIYGHIHNKTALNGEEYIQIKEYYKNRNAYNAGVDVVNYEPVTLDEMIKLKEANKDEPYIN